MPIKKDLKLDEYEISKFAYRELHNFCLQYQYKKQKLTEVRSKYNSPKITGIPHGSGVGDPAGNAAMQAASMARDIELIEKCAKAVSARDWEQIVLAVTRDVPWYYLRMLCNLETGEKKFNNERRYFYYLLAKEKNII